MSTITIPLTPELDTFVDEEVGVTFSTKAELVRQALTHYKEELAVRRLNQSRQEVKDGKTLKGDIRDLVKAL